MSLRCGPAFTLALLLVTACTSKPKGTADRDADAVDGRSASVASPPALAAAASDASMTSTSATKACKDVSRDCPSIPNCEQTCAKLEGEAEGFCALRVKTAEEGKPCVGHWISTSGMSSSGYDGKAPSAKSDRVFVCDVDQGLFCGSDDPFEKMPRCSRVRALGQKCSFTPYACGKDAECDAKTKTCKPLPTAGQPCPKSGCASGSVCKKNVCVGLKATNEACADYDDCLPGHKCENKKCVGATRPACKL